jgi:two-component system sensor histidine kinase GlrK
MSSFLRYALLALTAVLVPPAIAMFNATWWVEDLARRGAHTVVAAAETTDLARSLVEHVNGLENLARKRTALGGDALTGAYETRSTELHEVVDRLARQELPADARGRLSGIRATEQEISMVVRNLPADSLEYEIAVERFPSLAQDARALLQDTTAAFALASERMREQAEVLQRRIVGQVLLGLPLIAVVLLVSVVAIVRPLRTLDAAIRGLGAGELDRAIAIRGPADLAALGARLEWLRQRLLALESDRVRLFRHVSHELKTPLTNIREGAQLLTDGVAGRLTPDQAEITAILKDNAAELHRRIEDLLRISELRQQALALDLRSVDLTGEVEHVIAQNAVAARARSVTVAADLQPAVVEGDRLKLRTVFDNLVANAVKFSPAGGTISIAMQSTDDDVVVSVEDEGPGIGVTERERVFEPFYQGHATWLGHVGGTGLGLTIAREYVRAHGGELAIGDGRKGARVDVTIPRKQATA